MLRLIAKALETTIVALDIVENICKVAIEDEDSIYYWTHKGYFVLYESHGEYYNNKGIQHYAETEELIAVYETYSEAEKNTCLGRYFIACP